METKCLKMIYELQQTKTKLKEQEEKIENLQTTLLEAKEESNQLVYEKENVIQVQQLNHINISLQRAYQLVRKQQFD